MLKKLQALEDKVSRMETNGNHYKIHYIFYHYIIFIKLEHLAKNSVTVSFV